MMKLCLQDCSALIERMVDRADPQVQTIAAYLAQRMEP